MEAQIEKIQEMVNKDLEELKNKQSVMNNTITPVKNTVEGIKRGITEAEEWISEMENRMVEITVTEQNKEKRMKKMRTVSETSGTTLNAPTFKLKGSQKKRKRKGLRKYLKRL